MSTKTVDVRNAQESLADLISLVEEGTEVILTENDRPRARLVPVTPAGGRVAGLHEGAIWVSDDFDEPLSDEFWMGDEPSL